MGADRSAQLFRQHLGAQADAEERLFLFQRHADPVDFAGDPVVAVIGAHRPAEQHGASMILHCGGKILAQARLADIEPVALFHQHVADAAGSRSFGMQYDENVLGHGINVL